MIKKKKKREAEEVNASSMADIAFLLLIFFLVATTVVNEKGLQVTLPPANKSNEPTDINERELLKIILNSANKILVDDEPVENVSDLRKIVAAHVGNNGVLEKYSSSPFQAIVSFKADRGTTNEYYSGALDEIVAGYNTLRAKVVDMSVSDYLKLNKDKPEDVKLIELAESKIPMNLSIAEPSNVSQY